MAVNRNNRPDGPRSGAGRGAGISGTVEIRPERADDIPAIGAVNRLAFGQADEAALVDALRDGGFGVISLVAEDAGRIVGHIFFSRLPVEAGDRVVAGAALAPLAVLPDRQREGIGSALVGAGLAACQTAGIAAVVVLGHPDYYPRFGFSALAARGLRSPFPGAGDAFMALELVPGSLDLRDAVVRYAPPFGIADG
ncbi:MAG: N-acetyltransferase [Alphaproteobacteria bacterium]|nr:N-acetyltransferase [Alphaproteobacteria bacterium]